jgi:hypothetical protein
MADKNNAITAQGTTVKIKTVGSDDFICLTDIAKSKNSEHPDDLIRNWLRNRNTLELLGIWERLHNPAFNPVEFDGIKERAGLNSFTLTPKQWIEQVRAIGIQSKAGRYGGTYAHQDIAFEFASWVSVEFKLYLIKDFQRLKEDENNRLSLSWDLNRTLSKINYRIHTDAIKANLIPAEVSKEQAAFTYASEADLLNVALFRFHRQRMARRQPRPERQHPRPSQHRATSRPREYRVDECRVHPHEAQRIRTINEAQQHRHPADEIAHHKCRAHQTTAQPWDIQIV